jgi:cellulose synthase operon protein C
MPALMSRNFAFVAALALSAPGAAFAQAPGQSFIVDLPSATAPMVAPAPKPAPAASPAELASRPVATTPTALSAAPILGEGEGPDETALRYYAQLGQMERVNTEIERLVRLYPGWTPPLDLFNGEPPGNPDEDVYWELFSADKIDELRAAMDARKKEEPNWQPSRDLANKVRRKELRMRIMAFWKEGRLQDLVDYVKADGYNADDADVEMLWTIAEAFAKTKQTTEAVTVYLSILKSGADQPARLATVQKAMANLRMNDVEKLIAAGRVDANGRSEFSPIMVDVVRARISAYLHDERIEKIPANELAVFQEYAKGASDPNQSGLVAWYYYKVKSFRDALDWFKLSLERGGDAMIAHGLAHSLRELDMRRETEEVAYAWREPLVNNLILFVDILERDLTLEFPPFVEPDRLARYAKVTMDVASGEGAQALAWYAYNSCQYEVAEQWFQRAVAWFPKEATVYGYALTEKKLKRDKVFWDLMNRYDGLFGKVIEIIFPDGYYHPPTPCDELANQKLRPMQQTVGNYTVPGSYPMQQQPMGAPIQPGLTAAQAAGYSPYAQNQALAYRQQEPPKIDRKLFPAAVDPENPLRYVSSATPPARTPAQFAQAAAQIALQREPFRGPYQLVAGRVPGVGTMPYERYGFALLPGWNGVNKPTSPTYAAQIAPAGTLWATELPEKDRPKTAMQAGSGGGGGGGAMMAGAGGGSIAAGVNGAAPEAAPTSVPLVPTSIGDQSSALSANGSPVRVVGAPIGVTSGAPLYQQQASLQPAVAPVAYQAPAAQQQSQTPSAYGQPATVQPTAILSAAPQPLTPQLPDAADVGTLAQRAMQFFNEKNYSAALETLDRRAPLAPETTELRMIRGWSLLHLQRPEEARKAFATLGARSSGSSPQGSK